jgi:hypothetical protein
MKIHPHLTLQANFTEEVFSTVLIEMNCYYQQQAKKEKSGYYFDDIHNFTVLLIQMGHDNQDTIKNYCSTNNSILFHCHQV